jgi:ABC-type lipoprotein release transport system permease subunit
MKILFLFRLACNYLFRYRRRYLFLFLALTFGFGIVTFITSIKDGMYENVYNSAQSHYAGDIVVLGFDKNSYQAYHMEKTDTAAVLEAVENTGLNPDRIVFRSNFTDRGILYYNGAAVRLKYVTGVDWENEAVYFNTISYESPPAAPLKDHEILISAPLAHTLSARPGDSLILEVNTRTGQKNTGSFIVAGIVKDATIFGYYKSFLSRAALNRLIGNDPGDCSAIGLYFLDRRRMTEKQILLRDELARHIQTGPLVRNREDLYRDPGGWTGGVMVFVATIPVFLSEVADLLGAMNILTYFLYIMMLLIILVSAAVTYRLILHERTREIGTMRAIGFYGGDVRHILLAEAAGLALVSTAAGLVLARLFAWGVSFVSFSWFPSFDIFMKNGKLTALYLPKTMALNIAAAFFMLFAAVWFPAFRQSRRPLPPMLSGGDT